MDRNSRRWLALGLLLSTAPASFVLIAISLSGLGDASGGDVAVTASGPFGLALALATLTLFVVRWHIGPAALRSARATRGSTAAAASRA